MRGVFGVVYLKTLPLFFALSLLSTLESYHQQLLRRVLYLDGNVEEGCHIFIGPIFHREIDSWEIHPSTSMPVVTNFNSKKHAHVSIVLLHF